MRLRVLLGLTVAGFALLLGACGAQTSDIEKAYSAELEQARAQANHPEIVEALEDGEITDAEIERSKQIALECLAGRGVKASYDENDALLIAPGTNLAQNQVDALMAECSETTFNLLNPLKQAMAYNPQNIPGEQMIVDCYKRMNLVSASMTVDEFMQIDLNNPPWGKLSGDAAGCMDDPKDYRGGRPDLTEEEASKSEFIRVGPTP